MRPFSKSSRQSVAGLSSLLNPRHQQKIISIKPDTSSVLFIITIIIIVIFYFEPPFGQIKFMRELCILVLMPFW